MDHRGLRLRQVGTVLTRPIEFIRRIPFPKERRFRFNNRTWTQIFHDLVRVKALLIEVLAAFVELFRTQAPHSFFDEIQINVLTCPFGFGKVLGFFFIFDVFDCALRKCFPLFGRQFQLVSSSAHEVRLCFSFPKNLVVSQRYLHFAPLTVV